MRLCSRSVDNQTILAKAVAKCLRSSNFKGSRTHRSLQQERQTKSVSVAKLFESFFFSKASELAANQTNREHLLKGPGQAIERLQYLALQVSSASCFRRWACHTYIVTLPKRVYKHNDSRDTRRSASQKLHSIAAASDWLCPRVYSQYVLNLQMI